MKYLQLNTQIVRASSWVLALVAGAVTLHSQQSPIGPWDFVLRGKQKGVAQITFNADFTITGSEIITIRLSRSTDNDNPRGNPDFADPEDDSISNFFGAAPLTGTWTFADNSGSLVGILIESGGAVTNGISFRGRIRSNRLNLIGYNEGRIIHYRGVPMSPVIDISGNYFITGQKNGQPFVEMFNLTPDVTSNSYLLTGEGPAYATIGRGLVSSQRQLAIFAIQSIGTNGVLSAVSGAFNPARGKGSLTGRDEINEQVSVRVRKQGI
jgi:hypothetical protein